LLFLILLMNLVAAVAATRIGSPIGIVIGLHLLGAHIVGWTHPNPAVVLALMMTAYATVLYSVVIMRHPLLSGGFVREFVFWLGPMPILPAILGAVIRSQFLVAALRGALVVSALGLLLASKRIEPRSLAWGTVAGIHWAMLALIACGLAAPLGVVRFSGGVCACTHPNIIGLLSWTAAMMWLALPGVAPPLRAMSLLLCVSLIGITEARTAAGAGLVGSAAWLARVRGRDGLFSLRVRRVMLLMGTIGALSGAVWLIGGDFFLMEREPGVGLLSGREMIWKQAIREFAEASWLDKIVGSSEGGAAAAIRMPYSTEARALTTHNAIIGVLRLGGLAGLVCAAVGLWKFARATLAVTGLPAFGAAAGIFVGSAATILTESWFFTGGTLWVWLVIGARLAEKNGSPLERPVALRREVDLA
jgi:hypothetical protein